MLVDFAALLLLDNEEVKIRHLAVERNLSWCCGKVFHLNKDSNSDMDKLRIAMKMIKQKGIWMINRLIQQVDSLKSGVNSSNNVHAFIVQTSYSNLLWNVEHSCNTFCELVYNSLKYFWVGH